MAEARVERRREPGERVGDRQDAKFPAGGELVVPIRPGNDPLDRFLMRLIPSPRSRSLQPLQPLPADRPGASPAAAASASCFSAGVLTCRTDPIRSASFRARSPKGRSAWDAEEEVHGRADRLRLRQADAGTSVGEIRRKMGVAEATFYRWKKVYAGMGVSEIRRLKQLEEENGKLKRLVADLTLDKTMLQDVLRKKF
jgi:putative transposase